MSDPITPPAALVLGCNTPHGINVLSDWIEEQTGHAPDFHQSSFSNQYDDTSEKGCGSEYGNGRGNGHGGGYGFSNGDGYGDGFYNYGDGDGRGYGVENWVS